jgi:hypothetical protein
LGRSSWRRHDSTARGRRRASAVTARGDDRESHGTDEDDEIEHEPRQRHHDSPLATARSTIPETPAGRGFVINSPAKVRPLQ